MKKRTLLILIFCMSFSLCEAQDFLAVSIGKQTTSIEGLDQGRSSFIYYGFYPKGYTFSVSCGWKVTSRKALFVNLEHSFKGFNYYIPVYDFTKDDTIGGTVTASSLQIPFRYQYKVRKWFSISSGLYLGKILSLSDTSLFNSLGKHVAECNPRGYRKWETGFMLGALFTYRDLGLRLEFNRSLTRNMIMADNPKHFFGLNAAIIYYWNLKKMK